MARWTLRAVVFVGGLLVLTGCNPPPADEVFRVDTQLDTVDANVGDGICADSSGNCSLRAGVMEANADPNVTEIELTGGALGGTYQLTIPGRGEDAAATGDLDVTQPLYVTSWNGPMAVVNGGGLDRIFDFHAGAYHYLDRLQLTGGHAVGEDGGAILVRQGIVGVEQTHLTGNLASTGFGGGAASVGTGILWFEGSTISNNQSTNGGAGGIFANSTALTRVLNSTVSDNVSSDFFFGQAQILSFSYLDVILSTIQTNDPSGNSLVVQPGGSITVSDSIVDSCLGGAVSAGYNVAGASCGFAAAGDQTGDANLLPLDGVPGQPPTHRPTPNSIARDAIPVGSSGCVGASLTDGRGVPRPGGSACEAGAFELISFDLYGADCPNGVPGPIVAGGDFYGCDLTGIDLTGLDLSNADLRYANLSGVTAVSLNLSGADLTGANLAGTNLNLADLTGARLTDADVSGLFLFDADLGSVRSGGMVGSPALLPFFFETRGGFLLGPDVDLSGETLSIDLSNVTLTIANLMNADLRGATIVETNFNSADLRNVRFDNNVLGVNLGTSAIPGGFFQFADLSGANFSGATCHGCEFQFTNMSNTTLTGTTFARGTLADANLTGANANDVFAWILVQCPDGTLSQNNGNTCIGHL